MSLQTSVAFSLQPAFAGQVEGSHISTNNGEAEVVIQSGLFVTHGTDDGMLKLPTSSGEVATGLGIAPSRVTQDSRFPSGGTAGSTYQIGDTLESISQGKVWVYVEAAVNAGEQAYVRYATGTGTQKGAFRNDADTATAAAISARFRTSTSGAGLALLEINLP